MSSYPSKPIGILDIGSNSIRLVVFAPPFIGVKPIFNEKIQCALGRDIARTGVLHAGAKETALQSLKGFKMLANVMDLHTLKILGTAALREADNAQEFIEAVEAVFDTGITIIDGKEEARLAALGVLSTFPNASGVVADLGGGSLDMARITNGTIRDETTLPLGVLKTSHQDNKLDYIEECLNTQDLGAYRQSTLYAVGGTWRALARAHMHEQGLSAARSDGYQVTDAALQKFSLTISQKTAEAIASDYKIEMMRAELLPAAALLMNRLIARLETQHVIVSNAGMRDGALMQILEEGA